MSDPGCGTIHPSPKEMASIELRHLSVREAGNGGSGSPPPPINIPVYIHVITDSNGVGNVSDQAIQEQMQTLNGAYSGAQSAAAAKTPFTFTLAGVTRTANDAWFSAERNTEDEITMKTTLRQGSADDLNIYVRSLPMPLGGYATWPWNVPNLSQDGITVAYTTMPGGTYLNYSLGDVAVHEVGHWLGVYHTYHNGCDVANDYVNDTPAHQLNNGCPLPTVDSCTGKFKGTDPVYNFMNSTTNACANQFTAGQSSRMVLMWDSHRKGK